MKSRVLLAVVVLAPLLASASGVAQQDAGPSLLLSPAELEIVRGQHAVTALVLENPTREPLVFTLSARGAPDVATVTFASTQVRVAPGGVARVNASVAIAADAPPGEYRLTMRAAQAGTTAARDAAPLEAALRVFVPREGRLAPAVEPSHIETRALSVGESFGFSYTVRNPSPVRRAFEMVLELPEGWSGQLARSGIELAPHAFAEFKGQLTRGANASTLDGSLVVRDGDAATRIPLVLRAADGPLVDNARPLARPNEAGPTLAIQPNVALRVDPAEVVVAAGERASVTVFARNLDEKPVRVNFEFRLDAGLSGRLPPGPFDLPPGREVPVRFFLLATNDSIPGTLTTAAIGVRENAQAAALFAVRIAEPAAPVAAAADSSAIPAEVAAAGAVVAGAGLSVATFAAIRRRWPWLLTLPLYTRLKPSRLLDHPVRERLMALVRETPGITYGELERELGVAKGVLTHHARMLEQARHMFSSPDGQLRRFYPVDAGRIVPVEDLATRALAALQNQGPMSAAELARNLGVTRQALHYHLKKLQASGRVAAAANGGITAATGSRGS